MSSDFLVWKQAYSDVKRPLNRFDKTHLPKSKINKRYFNGLLKRQANARSMDKHIEFGIFDRESREFLGGVIIFILLRASTMLLNTLMCTGL